MDLIQAVPNSLKRHPAVRNVTLTGSRRNGTATQWSDWDFLVDTIEFDMVSASLPRLVHSLLPISYLWDPLYDRRVFMMILKGPIKVDLIFDVEHQIEPPRPINSETLFEINIHFWDWIFWIAGKQVRDLNDLVVQEIKKMYFHLLAPLGVKQIPGSIEETVQNFLSAFQSQKNLFHKDIDPELETEVLKGLKMMGFSV
jgi:predicted nucleotidyltransferase